jgi:hypothetical protein
LLLQFNLFNALGGNTSKTPTVIPLIFRIRTNSLPSERTATVVATYPQFPRYIRNCLTDLCYTTAKGEPRTARLEIMLPLALFCKIVPPIKSSVYKLTIDTGRRGGALLSTLFSDLTPESKADPSLSASDPDAPNMISYITIHAFIFTFTDHQISIQYHCGPDVTIVGSKSSGKYRVQSSHFEAMWLLLSELISRLQQFWKDQDASQQKSTPSSSEVFRITFTDELPFQVFNLVELLLFFLYFFSFLSLFFYFSFFNFIFRNILH